MDDGNPQHQHQESVSTLLFCRMCQAVYRQPKLLACLHSFCYPCLVNSVTRNAGGVGLTLSCPQCQHAERLSAASGVDGLQDNLFLDRLSREYISEVRSQIAAKRRSSSSSSSTSSTTAAATTDGTTACSTSSSEFTALRSRLSDELAHPKFSPSPGGSASRSRTSSSSSGGGGGSVKETPADDRASYSKDDGRHGSVGGGADAALESIRNRSRLQNKIMSLQGEALRVTYAIDQVNQRKDEWYQHKEDIRRAVERRSAQFQFFVKRVERQLLNQIDSKACDDQFYVNSDTSKVELRNNLKQILHQVSVLKCVQELGKDAEINGLSPSLLGPSTGVNEVLLNKLYFLLDSPAKSFEETVIAGFGDLKACSMDTSVFTPEQVDFMNIPLGIDGADDDDGDDDEKEERETPIMGMSSELAHSKQADSADLDSSTNRSRPSETSSRRSTAASRRNNRRYRSDLGLDNPEVKEMLMTQFRDARETLSNRRREILRQGQLARDDPSPMRGEPRKRNRSSSRNARGQPAERSDLSGHSRNTMTLPDLQRIMNRQTLDEGRSLDVGAENRADGASNPPPEPIATSNLQFGVGASHHVHNSHKADEEVCVPSPVLEEALSFPNSPQRRNTAPVIQTTELFKAGAFIPSSSPEEASGSEMTSPAVGEQQLPGLEPLQTSKRLTSTTSSGSSSRRDSLEHTPPRSPAGNTDVRGRSATGRSSSRPVRRAISSVADKRSKMEYLRETWQRRKEILIQNEGFVSTDTKPPPSGRLDAKPSLSSDKSPPYSPVEKKQPQTNTDSPSQPLHSPNEGSARRVTPDKNLSEVPPVNTLTGGGRMQQLRDRISSLTQQTRTTNGSDLGSAVDKAAVSNETQQGTELFPRENQPKIILPVAKPTAIADSESVTSVAVETHKVPATSVLSTTSTLNRIYPIRTTSSVTTTTVSRPTTRTLPPSTRFSKSYIIPSDDFDIAKKIAAMYSGNEESILSSRTSSTQSQEASKHHETAATATTTTTTTTTTTSLAANNTTIEQRHTPTDPPPSTHPVVTGYPRRLASSIPLRSQAMSYTSNVTRGENLLGKTESAGIISQLPENGRDSVHRATTSGAVRDNTGVKTMVSTPPPSSSSSSSSSSTSYHQPDTRAMSNIPRSKEIGLNPTTQQPQQQQQQQKQQTHQQHTTGEGLAAVEPPIANSGVELLPQRHKPPSLHLVTKHGSLQDDTALGTTATTASTIAPSPSPTQLAAAVSPTGVVNTDKGRLREITRKKKERWRHLTIH